MGIRDWARAAGVRAVKTAAQTTVAIIGTNAVGITDVDSRRQATGYASGANDGSTPSEPLVTD